MKFVILVVVLFTSFVFTLQRPIDNESANAKILKFENVLNSNGEYHFEFETSDGTTRWEKAVLKPASDGTEILAVIGSYSYYDPTGKQYTVDYIADDSGYYTIPYRRGFPVIPRPAYGMAQPIAPSAKEIDKDLLITLAGSGI